MAEHPEPVALYEPRPLGTKALQRLGAQIGNRAQLDAEETRLYEELIRDAKDRVVAVQDFCERLLEQSHEWNPRLKGADIVGRVKTLSTLADKLERTPSEKLPSIHDVAGVRIVADLSLMEQKVAASVLSSGFDSIAQTSRPALLIDRLENPMYGYRALHLVVWPGGRPVEIQIRTELQHAWAQFMEVLGDRWGREARYGLPIVGKSKSEKHRRTELVDWMQNLSAAIAAYEVSSRNTGLLHLKIDDGDIAGLDSEVLRKLRDSAKKKDAELAGTKTALVDLLRSLPENFSG